MNPPAWRWIGVVVAVQVAVLTALSGRYGFHRDELYFLAAGRHPAWGYVDQPPLTPLLARAATAVFGDTLVGLRVPATVIAALGTVVMALAAREFGSGPAGQVFAGASFALSGYVLAVTHMVSTATTDLVIWMLALLLLIRVLRGGSSRWWPVIGLVVGVALLNKWLILLLVAAVGLSVLVAGPRDRLRDPWLLLGVVVALLVASPNFVWQARHGWPQLTVAGGISADDGTENRVMFVPDQILYLSPVLVPVWVVGLVRTWRDPALRWLALSYPVLCVVILLLGGKPYYVLPLLLMMLAAGASVAVLRLRHWWPFAVVAVAISVVLGLPVLPVRDIAPALAVNKELGEQVGWPRFAATVRSAWQQIPAASRPGAVVFTENYGEAGALQRYAPALPTYSGHMSYGDWGPPPASKTGPVLVVAPDFGTMDGAFTGCRTLARIDNGLGVDNDEQGTSVSLCRLTQPWSQLWHRLRHYY